MNKMNTIKKLAVAAFVAMVGLCGSLWAAPAAESDFTFDSTTGTITGYKGAGGDVEIPATIGGVEVKAIKCAFVQNASLKSVTIPASVTNIYDAAFASSGMTNVTFAAGSQLKTIGESAFNLTWMKELTIPASVREIGTSAFARNEFLRALTFEEGSQLEVIGDSAFNDCYMTNAVVIPANVKHIGYQAFSACLSAAAFIFAEDSQLETIGGQAFIGINSVRDFTIPASVTNIGNQAFSTCDQMTNLTVLATTPPTAGEGLFEYCPPELKIRVPEGMAAAYKAAPGWSAYADLITDGATPTADPVEYYTWDVAQKKLVPQTCTEYTVVTADMATFESGWYVVNGAVTNTTNCIGVNGNVHLILMDGAELVVLTKDDFSWRKAGVAVHAGNSLTIYGQVADSGRLTVSGGYCAAAIGGDDSGGSSGTIVVNGGTVTATGGAFAAAIGGGYNGPGGTMVFNGGVVLAKGSVGIGGGENCNGGVVTINGGNITAFGNTCAIGDGIKSSSSGAVAFGDAVSLDVLAGNSENAAMMMTREQYEKDHSAKYMHFPAVGVTLPETEGLVFTFSNGTEQVTSLSYNGMVTCCTTNHGALAVYFSLMPSYNFVEPQVGPMVFSDITGTIVVPKENLPRTYQTPVEYFDWDATAQTLVARTCSAYRLVQPTTKSFEDGKWYVVDGAVKSKNGGIVVNGSAHLILKDGAELEVVGAQNKAGIDVSVSGSTTNSLAIFGQAEGSGRLLATGGMYGAAIGGQDGEAGGSITINGGDILANGGFCACAIGGGAGGMGTQVTINGGNVKAYGDSSSGIGGNQKGRGFGIVTINGGVVYAEGDGKASGSGIGGGYLSDGTGTINFNGGIVTAYAYGGHAIGNSGSGPQSCVKVGFATDKHFAILTGTQSPGGYISAEDFTKTYDQPYVHIEAGKVVFKANQSVGLKMAVSNETGEVSLSVYDGVGYYLADPGDTLKAYLALGPSYLWKSPLESNPVEITMGQTMVALEDYIPQIYQTPVEYLEWDRTLARLLTKTCEHYTVVTPETSNLPGGWYVVMEDIDHSGCITVAGTADNPTRLILCDGVTWQRHSDFERGIVVGKGNVLSIYGQRECTGKLNVPCTSYTPAAVIGGDWNYQNCGTINVNGGTIVASSRSGEAIGKSGEDSDMFGAVNLSEGFAWQVSVGDEGHDEQTVSAEEYMLDHHWRYAKLVAKPTTFVTAQPFNVTSQRENGYFVIIPPLDAELAVDECWVSMGLPYRANQEICDGETGRTYGQAFVDEVYGFVAGAEPVVAGSRSIAGLTDIVKRYWGYDTFVGNDSHMLNNGEMDYIVLMKCRRASNGELMVMTIGLVGNLQETVNGEARPNELSTAVRTSYYAWNDETRRIEGPHFVRAMPITENTRTLRDGQWYVALNGKDKFETLTVSGDAHLILEDGCDVDLLPRYEGKGMMPGLRLLTPTSPDDPTFSSISIYGQKEGTGKLSARGDAGAAGIGTGPEEFGQTTINIHGGQVTAYGGKDGAAAIGTGVKCRGFFYEDLSLPSTLAVNVYGGTVTANAEPHVGGPGIGFGNGSVNPKVALTVLGGDVTCTCGPGAMAYAIGWGQNCNKFWSDPDQCDYLKLTLGRGMGLWAGKGSGEGEFGRISPVAYDERIRMGDPRAYARIMPAPVMTVEVVVPQSELYSYEIYTNGVPMEVENPRVGQQFTLPGVVEVEVVYTAADGYLLDDKPTWSWFIGADALAGESAFRVEPPEAQADKLISRQHFELVRNGDGTFTLALGDDQHVGLFREERWFVVTDGAEAGTLFNDLWAEAQAAVGKKPVGDFSVLSWDAKIKGEGGTTSAQFSSAPQIVLNSSVGRVMVFKVRSEMDGTVMTAGGELDLQTMTAGGDEIRTGSLDAAYVEPLRCEVKVRNSGERDEDYNSFYDFTFAVKDASLAAGESYFYVAYNRLDESGLDESVRDRIRRRREELARMARDTVGIPVGNFELRLHNMSVYSLFENAEAEYYASTGRIDDLAALPAALPRGIQEVYAFRVRAGANGDADAKVVAIGHCAGIRDNSGRYVNDFAGETMTLSYYAWDEAAGKVVEQPPVEAIVLPEPENGKDLVLHGNRWYVVVGNRHFENTGLRVDVGTAHLILAAGANLEVSGGVTVDPDATLAIYSEEEPVQGEDGEFRGHVELRVSSADASRSREPVVNGGSLEIHGGSVSCYGAAAAAIANRRTSFYDGNFWASSHVSGGSVISSRRLDILGGRFGASAIDNGSGEALPYRVVAGEQDGYRCELNIGRGAFVEFRNDNIGRSSLYGTIGNELDVRLDDGVFIWAGDYADEIQMTTLPIYRARPKFSIIFNWSQEKLVQQDFEITAVYDENLKTNGFTLTLPAEDLRDGEKWCVIGFDERVARLTAEGYEGMTLAADQLFKMSVLVSVGAALIGDNMFAADYINDGIEHRLPCFSVVTGESTVEIPADRAVDFVMVARVIDTASGPMMSLGAAIDLQSMDGGETKGCGFEFLSKQEFSVERNADGTFAVTMPEGDILKPNESWAWVVLVPGVGDDDRSLEEFAMQFGGGIPANALYFDRFMDGDMEEVLAWGVTTDSSFTLPRGSAGLLVGKCRPGLSMFEGPCEYLALTLGMASHLNVADYKDWPRHDELFPTDADYCKLTLVENDQAVLIVAVDGSELGYRPDGVYTIRKGSEVRVRVLPVDPDNYELRSPSMLVYTDIQEDVTVGPQQVVVVPKAAPTPVADQGFAVRRGDDGTLTVDMSGEEPLGPGEMWVCLTLDKGGSDLPDLKDACSFGDILWRDAMGVIDDVNAGELPLDMFMVVPGAEGVVVSTNETFAIPSDSEMALVARAYDGYNGKVGGNRYYGLSLGGVRFLTALKPGESAEGELWNAEHQVRYSAWDGEKIVHGLTTNALPLTAASFGANGILSVTNDSFYEVTGKLESDMNQLVIDVKAGVTMSLLVKDGARMRIKAIHLPATATLNVYGQDNGSGAMAFIGNLPTTATIGGMAGEGCGTINFHGPMVSFSQYTFGPIIVTANATAASAQAIHMVGSAKIGSTLDSDAENGTLNVYRGVLSFSGGCAIGGGKSMQVNLVGGEISVDDGWIGGMNDRKTGLVPGEGYQLQCKKAEDAIWTDMTVAEYEEELKGEVPPAGVRVFRPAEVTFDAEIAKLVADGKLTVMVSYQGKVGAESLPMTWTEAGGSCTVTCGRTVNVICLANGTESIRRPDVMTFGSVTGNVAVAYADLNWHEPELVAAQKFEAYRCLDGRVRLTPRGKLAEGEAWLWIALPDYVAQQYAGDVTIAEKFAKTLKTAVGSKMCYVGGVNAASGSPVVEPMLRPLYNCIQGNMFLPTDGFHWGVSKEKSVFYAPADTDFAVVCKVYDAGIGQMTLALQRNNSAPAEAAEATAEAAAAPAQDQPKVQSVAASGTAVSAGSINVNKELFLSVGCRFTAETAGSASDLQMLPRLPEYEPGDPRNPWLLGPDDADEPVAYTNDTNTLVIEGVGPFAEPTKKPWLEEGAGPITEIVIKNPETELPDDIFAGLGTPTPVSVDLPDGWPADDLPVPGQPWHGGYVKIEDGHWPLTVSNVKFQQRYPWNGLVDVTFELTGSTNVELGVWAKSGATTIAASNFVGRTDMMFAIEGKETVKLVWDAEKDLLPGDLTKLVLTNTTITVGTDSSAGSGSGGKVIRFSDAIPEGATVSFKSPMPLLTKRVTFDLEPGDEIVVEAVYTPAVNGSSSGYLALCAPDPMKGQRFGTIPEPCLAAYKAANGDFAAGEGEYRFAVTEEVVEAFKIGWLCLSWGNEGPRRVTDSVSVKDICIVKPAGGIGAESAAGVIDLAKGTRVARDIEGIVIDPAWGAAAKASVLWPKAPEATEYDAATIEQWNTARLPAGQYEFTYTAGSTSYTAAFWLPADNWTVIDHETIAGERPVTGEKVLVAGENVIKAGGKLVIAGEPEIIWDGTFRVEKGGKIYAPYFDVVVDPETGLVTLEPKARPTVTGLRFAQRYPWNGLVDVFFTATYAADPAAKVWVKLAAKLDGEEKTVKTLYLASDPATTNTQFQVAQGEIHLIWDTMKDVGLENFGALEITAQAALIRMAEEAQPEKESKILCLTAVDGAVDVRVENPLYAYTDYVPNIEYSKDGEIWMAYPYGNTKDYHVITIEQGERVYFRGTNPKGLNPPELADVAKEKDYEDPSELAVRFRFEIRNVGAKVEASGSVMSLIDGKGEATEIPDSYCFAGLFKEARYLTKAPDLTATTVKWRCYYQMFDGTRVSRIKMMMTGENGDFENVLHDVLRDLPSNGVFVISPYWKGHGFPSVYENREGATWKIVYDGEENLPEPLCFTSVKGSGDLHIEYNGKRELNIEISYDGQMWQPYDPRKNGSFYLKSGEKLYVRGKNPEGLTNPEDGYLTFQPSVPFNVSGNVMSLIDYEKKVAEIPCDYCFSGLFANAKIATADLELPATVLKPYCYQNMFAGCQVMEGRMVLPAKDLVDGCYEGMFNNCNNLSYIKMLAETYNGDSKKFGEVLLKDFTMMLNNGAGKAYGGIFVYSSNAAVSAILPRLKELGAEYNWSVVSESEEKEK